MLISLNISKVNGGVGMSERGHRPTRNGNALYESLSMSLENVYGICFSCKPPNYKTEASNPSAHLKSQYITNLKTFRWTMCCMEACPSVFGKFVLPITHRQTKGKPIRPHERCYPAIL